MLSNTENAANVPSETATLEAEIVDDGYEPKLESAESQFPASESVKQGKSDDDSKEGCHLKPCESVQEDSTVFKCPKGFYCDFHSEKCHFHCIPGTNFFIVSFPTYQISNM